MPKPTPPAHSDDDTPGRSWPRLLDAVALGAVLALAWQACSATKRRRLHARSARVPADVHTWEGEGGPPLPDDHDAVDIRPRKRA